MHRPGTHQSLSHLHRPQKARFPTALISLIPMFAVFFSHAGGLETNVRYYQDKTERAEEWLHKIFTEIEERFFTPDGKHSGVNGSARPIGRRA